MVGDLPQHVGQRSMADRIDLTMEDLRAVAAYAAETAAHVLSIFEQCHPSDTRPRDALEATRTFVQGGRRSKALRDAAWAALKAARQAEDAAASQAARAAMCAASAAYLHPLASATQLRHILGAAAHAARAVELAEGDGVDADPLQHAIRSAPASVIEVLCRYPSAPAGGGQVGELLRCLDRELREISAKAGARCAQALTRR